METNSVAKPHMIIMVGIPGSGKSFFAENFAESFKAPIISSEVIRNKLFIAPDYSTDEDLIILSVSDILVDQILKTSQTVVYRGNTETKAERTELYKKCKGAGYQPLLVWVQTDEITAKKRFISKITDKNLALSLFDQKMKRFSKPINIEKPVVVSGKHTYASQLKIILAHLTTTRGLANIDTPNAQMQKRRLLIS